jgi:FkbM family methyltransferase
VDFEMTTVRERFDKPEYLLRPSQVLRRWSDGGSRVGRTKVILPWGLPLWVNPADVIGRAVCRLGLYDLTVSEALWRLCDEGDLTVDAGANIGHMTSILARRCGPRGRVLAFEPHPILYAELEQNAVAWKGVSVVELRQTALCNQAGRGVLFEPDSFACNRGTAQVVTSTKGQVRLAPLDAEVPFGVRIGLLKIDVEGSELNVLEGAARLLDAGLIRDIVFEDFAAQASPCRTFLERFGYRVFALGRRFFGPRLVDSSGANRPWEPPSFLATLEPIRAVARMKPRGWQTLRHKRNDSLAHHNA